MATALEAKKRENKQRSELKNLRDLGNIPAVIYGYKAENTPIYVSEADFLKVIRETGRNGVISLNVDGDKRNVILNAYQEDSIKKDIIHIDFLAVDMEAEIEANVRVELVGECQGVKDGGVLQQPVHELSVLAKPNELPESIQVDVSNLQVGDTISVADIKGTFSYQITQEDELTIASVLAPRQEEEISTGEEQEPGIPDNLEGRETTAEKESE
ncbi:50S ribosomal protein L25/general stress protein Ctc [Heyndrickxia sp. NPDC080065]|uniref:50S ribosomal protein L25/general stress protein Ctc n=1 Tax=Heyndrickxia sp. NPDC080065 TaxID=3390568 RepID=UPI003D084F71